MVLALVSLLTAAAGGGGAWWWFQRQATAATCARSQAGLRQARIQVRQPRQGDRDAAQPAGEPAVALPGGRPGLQDRGRKGEAHARSTCRCCAASPCRRCRAITLEKAASMTVAQLATEINAAYTGQLCSREPREAVRRSSDRQADHRMKHGHARRITPKLHGEPPRASGRRIEQQRSCSPTRRWSSASCASSTSQIGGAIDREDMEQIGLMGLLEALRRYGAPDARFGGYRRAARARRDPGRAAPPGLAPARRAPGKPPAARRACAS